MTNIDREMANLIYNNGKKEGRKQIIRNLKKHYDETYFSPPENISDCDIGVYIPERTLLKYFKEFEVKNDKRIQGNYTFYSISTLILHRHNIMATHTRTFNGMA